MVDIDKFKEEYRELFKNQVIKKFENSVDGFLKFVKATTSIESSMSYNSYIDKFEEGKAVEIETISSIDMISDLASNSVFTHYYLPELLAQLSFNDPEFIKALPDWVFGAEDVKCYPLVPAHDQYNMLKPDFNAKPVTFREVFLDRLESIYQDKVYELGNQYDDFEKFSKDTKEFLETVNGRFVEAEKKTEHNQKSKKEVLDLFKQSGKDNRIK